MFAVHVADGRAWRRTAASGDVEPRRLGRQREESLQRPPLRSSVAAARHRRAAPRHAGPSAAHVERRTTAAVPVERRTAGRLYGQHAATASAARQLERWSAQLGSAAAAAAHAAVAGHDAAIRIPDAAAALQELSRRHLHDQQPVDDSLRHAAAASDGALGLGTRPHDAAASDVARAGRLSGHEGDGAAGRPAG